MGGHIVASLAALLLILLAGAFIVGIACGAVIALGQGLLVAFETGLHLTFGLPRFTSRITEELRVLAMSGIAYLVGGARLRGSGQAAALQNLRARLDDAAAALAAGLRRENALQDDLEKAQRDLALALHAASGLRARVEELEAAQKTSSSERDPVYRKVGLDPAAPDWIVRAARREYRRRLHPDARPSEQKEEATKRFQRAEACFDEIYTRRMMRT